MEIDSQKIIQTFKKDKYAWLLVITPIFGLLFELIAGQDIIWIYLLLNIIFLTLDYKELKAKEVEPPHVAWVALIPVYLWKRATILNQEKHYFWGWIGVFVLSLLLSSGGGQRQIEEAAIPLVTQILQNELGTQAATCVNVKIDDFNDFGLYDALAVLDNGMVISITITEGEGDMIYVNIPLDQ